MTSIETGRADPRELALRIQAGERAAEDELVQRYSSGVAIIVRRIVRDPSSTDDLCQEAFRLVLEKLRRGELREPEKLSGFICNLARNLAIEHVRRPQRTQTLEEPGLSVADPTPDQLSSLIEQEKVRAVRQVLEEMTAPRDREILRRFYLQGEDKESLCAELGLSGLHFNRVLYRARERFRELYEQDQTRRLQ
jgi:RNA polymerase sigma-70 factor (ECF subfamily)